MITPCSTPDSYFFLHFFASDVALLMSLNVFMLFSGTPLLVTALALDIAPAVTATVFVVFSMLALALSPNPPKFET